MNCLFNKYRDIKMIILSIILITSMIVLLILCIFLKFNFSDSYMGIVRLEDDFYVYLLIDDSKIQEISSKRLVLNKKYLDYEIVRIDSEYTITESGALKGIYLKMNFDDSYKINNNVLNLKFISKKTIFEKFKEML